jgi:hypothetical protein
MELAYKVGDVFTSLYIDAAIRESHSTASQITEHPVEQGANVADHVRPELEKLTFDVYFTNTPIRLPKSHVGTALSGDFKSADLPEPPSESLTWRRDGGPTLVSPVIPPQRLGLGLATDGVAPEWQAAPLQGYRLPLPGVNVLQFSSEFDRVRLVYDALRQLVIAGTLCRILTTLRQYDNMVLRSMDTPRDVQSGSAITVTIEAMQVRLVATETVTAPKTAQVRARPTKNEGPKPGTKVEPKPQEKASFASQLTGLGIVVP